MLCFVSRTHDLAPTLDRSCEPWVGVFPGLGRITVAVDGSVDVEPDPTGSEDHTLREQALRFGWAEGLSWARRGYQLASGSAVCPPGTGPAETGSVGCVLLTGDLHDVRMVLADLVKRSWRVMSDRITPTQWENGRLIAHPREAPILMARRHAAELEYASRRVRADTDACAVDLPRHTDREPVSAVVVIGSRRMDEAVVEPMVGQQRFEYAAALMQGGVLALECAPGEPDDVTQEKLDAEAHAEYLRLATLPTCTLRIGQATLAADVAALADWLANSTDIGWSGERRGVCLDGDVM